MVDDDGGIIWFRIEFFNMLLGFPAISAIWVQRKESETENPNLREIKYRNYFNYGGSVVEFK